MRCFLLLLLLLPCAAHAAETGVPARLAVWGSQTPAEQSAAAYAQQELTSHPLHSNIPDYTLSPAALAKSQELGRMRLVLHFGEQAWTIAILFLLLELGIAARLRAAALRLSKRRWSQGIAFLFFFLMVTTLLQFPLDLYAQHMQRANGLSVQSWPSWTADQAKMFALTWLIGAPLVLLLFAIIRRFPARWWLVSWALCIPLVLAGVFAVPYLSPLFDRFEPLTLHHADLVAQLEQVVARGHMNIPPDRMFLMKASDKVTTMNAYVTGFGASKRVVVWDTSLTHGTPDEVLFIFGHESGHYVLGHIAQGIALSIVTLFFAGYIAYRVLRWTLHRCGARWRIGSQNDYAALAILLLIFAVMTTAFEPIQSAVSRHDEHAADIYGQEAIHGLVENPQATAQAAFDVLGRSSFSDPNPNRFYEFWAFDHPSIPRRAAFAHAYNPWQPGLQPKYLKR
jgi:STE24 endopeptidase